MTPLNLTQRPPRSPRAKLRGLYMLPRMIDIARAKLPGGNIGEYQIGLGMSGVVLGHFGITVDDFVRLVGQANDEDEIADRLCPAAAKQARAGISARLRSLTVKDVPADLRSEFQRLYGADQPDERRVFDVIEEDDSKTFGTAPQVCD